MYRNLNRLISRSCLCAALVIASISTVNAQSTTDAVPRIVQKDGRFALFVDGAPYLILGAQTNNSSAWPAMLPKVWPAMESMHVNTVEIPIYWEQFEPEQGRFDYSVVDAILDGSRNHGFRLVLLWFGTWKNGSNHYMPPWMKLDPERYPNMIGPDGKEVYPLPLYVNGAIRDPIDPGWPPHYEVGGPNDNVFALWKAAAPAVDLLAPDIYIREQDKYLKVLDDYARSDNPLFVPETIGFGSMTRYFFAALGRGAIGYAPFGMDYTRPPLFANRSDASPEQVFQDTAINYELIGPMSREIARLNFEGKLQTAIEMEAKDSGSVTVSGARRSDREPDHVLHFDDWDVEVFFGTFRRRTRIPPAADAQPTGRILVGQLGDDQFLMTGLHTRVTFRPTGTKADRPWQYLAAEEGSYVDGTFEVSRILNGDQTDWGLFFTSEPRVLRVSVYTR